MLSDRCLSVLSCPVCDVGVLCLNRWMDQDETWQSARPRLWPHCVRWGLSSPPQRGRAVPPITAHICCGEIASWIKIPLGTQVGLGPGDIVLVGNSSPPTAKRTQPLIFGPYLLWPNGCMYQDITWYGGRPQPRRHCVRWEPSSPPLKGQSLPNFRPMSVVAKRLDGLRCRLVWPRPRRLCVRWGSSCAQKKGHSSQPIFGPCLLWPNGWMDVDAT